MALQQYEKGAIFLKGALLVEATNFHLEHDAALQPIHTMQKGFAGVSPGSPMTKGSVSSGIPRVGVELDYLQSLQDVEVIEFVVFAHSKKKKFKGYLTNIKEQYGADRAAEISFDFIGVPVEQSTL